MFILKDNIFSFKNYCAFYAGGLLYQQASNFSAHTSRLQQINLLIIYSYCNKENCPNKKRHKEYLSGFIISNSECLKRNFDGERVWRIHLDLNLDLNLIIYQLCKYIFYVYNQTLQIILNGYDLYCTQVVRIAQMINSLIYLSG